MSKVGGNERAPRPQIRRSACGAASRTAELPSTPYLALACCRSAATRQAHARSQHRYRRGTRRHPRSDTPRLDHRRWRAPPMVSKRRSVPGSISVSARFAAHQKWKSSPAFDSGAPTILFPSWPVTRQLQYSCRLGRYPRKWGRARQAATCRTASSANRSTRSSGPNRGGHGYHLATHVAATRALAMDQGWSRRVSLCAEVSAAGSPKQSRW